MTVAFAIGDRGKTRDGADYRIVCVDAFSPRNVIALVMRDGKEWPVGCQPDGRRVLMCDDDDDLLYPEARA